jgi:hypothetical protein
MDRERLVSSWAEKDRARAVLRVDREIIDAAGSLRMLIVDLVLSGAPGDELFDACAMLGHLVAQREGSPTLASATMDNAAEALGTPAATWVPPARAAVAEGFAAALTEAVQTQAMLAWEFPNCAVRLGQAALAVAAGHPSDDEEVLAAWAARVAKSAALAGVRRAVVSGTARACAALLDAFGLVGIEVTSPGDRG